MRARILLSALAAALALHAGHAAAQQQRTGVQHHTTVSNANPANGRAARTFGFAWKVGVHPGANGSRSSFDAPTVTFVAPGSNAARAGVAVGDTIVEIDGRDARQPPIFADRTPGREYTLRVRRGGEELELRYVVPPPQPAQ